MTAITSLLFGGIQGAISPLDPFVRLFTRFSGCKANRNRDMEGDIFMADSQSSNRSQQALGHALSLLNSHLVAEDGELLPAVAGDAILIAGKGSRQAVRQRAEGRIACRMSIGIIDRLKMIGVNQEQADGFPEDTGHIKRALQLLEKDFTIAEPGQRI